MKYGRLKFGIFSTPSGNPGGPGRIARGPPRRRSIAPRTARAFAPALAPWPQIRGNCHQDGAAARYRAIAHFACAEGAASDDRGARFEARLGASAAAAAPALSAVPLVGDVTDTRVLQRRRDARHSADEQSSRSE